MPADMPRLRVGLAGAGFLAQTRARCWRRVAGVDVSLSAVSARREERARGFAKTHGVAAATGDWRVLVDRPDVDLIDVCLPNHLHREVVEAAASAGKAIICTKPLAAYVGQDLAADATDAEVAGQDRRAMASVALADARAMVAAAEAASVPLMYGENWVYAPSIVRAAGLLASSDGRLLEMRGEESHSGSHAEYALRWRHAGGGALLRLGAHPIGAMLHLKRVEAESRGETSPRVIAVTAETADPITTSRERGDTLALASGPRDVESWGCLVLHFEDGARGVAIGSDLALGGMQSSLELRTGNARLLCRLSPHDLLDAYAPTDGTFGESYVMEKVDGQAGWTTPLPDEDWSSGQQGMLQAFAEAAVRGETPASDGALGLAVTRVLSAAYVAAAEGRRVALDESEQGNELA